MTSRERVLSSIAKQGYDRIPIKHEGTPEVNALLREHFGLANDEQLLRVLGDDFRYADPVYIGPELRTFPDGSIEGYWGERYKYAQYDGGKYLEAVHLPFANVETLEQLDRSHFPSADWFDYSTLRAQCDELHKQGFAVCFGTAGDGDYINGISRARGMEEVMMDLVTDNPAYLAIMQARADFYYHQHERALQAAGGRIDIVHLGEDLGHQFGPMISMAIFEQHFVPKYQRHFEMAHRYGAKTLMHMCGCVEKFLPRLIEIGLDIQDVVQPTTPEMDVAYLHDHYGSKLSFCGTMCVQTTLPHGTTADVEREVQRRLKLFANGGLILGPTHAVQVGTPLENVLAMYRAAGSLREKIDSYVLSAGVAAESGKPNMSKLF